MKFNKIILIIMSLSFIFSQSAFAGRLGGGRNYGMQRSYSKPSNNYYSQQQPRYNSQHNQPAPQPQYQQQHSGMGAGTAAALGAAAGAAGGYMLGRSTANNQQMQPNQPIASAPQQSATAPTDSLQNNIPWGTIGILVILLILGLMLFRKKANPGLLNNSNQFQNDSNNNGFNAPNVTRSNYTNQPSFGSNNQPIQQVTPTVEPFTLDKMPDGIETVYFLRQVKGMFLHIQSMNTSENVSEIEKYMTPDLYQEIKSDVANNANIADFTNLDCALLDCEVNNNQFIASVKFFGLVSENPTDTPKPFSEVWNFVKSELTANKWLVAGIQQETLN